MIDDKRKVTSEECRRYALSHTEVPLAEEVVRLRIEVNELRAEIEKLKRPPVVYRKKYI